MIVKSETVWNAQMRSTFLYMRMTPEGRLFTVSTRRLTEDEQDVYSTKNSEAAWATYDRLKRLIEDGV